jgi:autotransporter-associated beta strand protein
MKQKLGILGSLALTGKVTSVAIICATMVLCAQSAFAQLYWWTDGTGGAGTWNNANGNTPWSTAETGGGPNAKSRWDAGQTAVFGAYGAVGSSSAITIGAAVTATAITFRDGPNYTFSGTAGNSISIANGITIATGPNNLTQTFSGAGGIILGGANTWNIVDSGDTLAVNTTVSGGNKLTKTGAGTLTLSGNNNYTGGTTLSGGTLQANSSTALGASSGDLNMNGGTLDIAGGVNLSVGALSLSTPNSTISFSGSGSRITFDSLGNIASELILNVVGWDGADNKLFLSNFDPGTQNLSFFQFDSYPQGAMMIAGGELVPVPEPINVALGIFGVLFVGFKVGRRYFGKPAQPAATA